MNSHVPVSLLVLTLTGMASAAETPGPAKAEAERPAILVPQVELPNKVSRTALSESSSLPGPTSDYLRKVLAEKVAEKRAAQAAASIGAGQPTGNVDNPVMMAPFVLEEETVEKAVKLPEPPPTIAETIRTGKIYRREGKYRTTRVDSLGESTRTGHGRITLGLGISW